MKTNLKKLAITTLLLLAAVTVQAAPIALPENASANQTGNFSINPDNTLTLTGSPVTLTTSAAKGDIAQGSARFMSGILQYKEGSNNLDGQMAKVTLGSQIKNGQVIYLLNGLIYGKLTQANGAADVNGNFSVQTKPAPEGTALTQAQLDSASLLLTVRSNINNTEPNAAAQSNAQQHQK